MNKRTNAISAVLNTLLIGTGLYVGIRYLMSQYIDIPLSFMGIITPAHTANYYYTIDAINMFSNSPIPIDLHAQTMVSIALGTLLILVIIPFAIAKLTFNKNRNQLTGVWSRSVVLAMILSVMVPGVTSIFNHFNNVQTNKAQISASREMDELRRFSIDLAFNAAERMLMPAELGGGDGSFNAVLGQNGTPSTIALEDILPESGNAYSFRIQEPVRDSTLMIIGMSQIPGRAPFFKNMNGETGKAQFAVLVTPYEEDTYKIVQEFSN